MTRPYINRHPPENERTAPAAVASPLRSPHAGTPTLIGSATQAEPIATRKNSDVRHKLAAYLETQTRRRGFSNRQQAVAQQFFDLMERVGGQLESTSWRYTFCVGLADDPKTSLILS